MEKKQSSQKTKNFLKKNVYYIIMAVCLLAIAAMITVTVLINNGTIPVGDDKLNTDGPNEPTINDPIDNGNNGNNDSGNNGNNGNNGNTDKDPGNQQPNNPNPDKPTDTEPVAIVFASPVADVNVIQEYSMDMLVWNSTLKHYAVHNGIDFGGAEGTNVYSAYDGVVTSVTYDVLNGNTVTIKHGDKLYTTYSSLNEPVVTVGQTVAKGGVIGTMGVTATAEYAMGAHVHFSVMEDGNIIDPETYLTLSSQK